MQYTTYKVIVVLVASFLPLTLTLHCAENKSVEQYLVATSELSPTSKGSSLFTMLPYELKRQLVSLAPVGAGNFEELHELKGHTEKITSVCAKRRARQPVGENPARTMFNQQF